jgi:hypothetical protein
VTATGEAAVVHVPKGKSEAAASAARYISAITVAIPMNSAGSTEGDRAHSKPYVHSNSVEKVMPIE